jgi:hypothetical protein
LISWKGWFCEVDSRTSLRAKKDVAVALMAVLKKGITRRAQAHGTGLGPRSSFEERGERGGSRVKNKAS